MSNQFSTDRSYAHHQHQQYQQLQRQQHQPQKQHQPQTLRPANVNGQQQQHPPQRSVPPNNHHLNHQSSNPQPPTYLQQPHPQHQQQQLHQSQHHRLNTPTTINGNNCNAFYAARQHYMQNDPQFQSQISQNIPTHASPPTTSSSSAAMPLSLANPANAYTMNCYQTSASGWAGVPLITTVARRSRKSPTAAAGNHCNGFDSTASDAYYHGAGASNSRPTSTAAINQQMHLTQPQPQQQHHLHHHSHPNPNQLHLLAGGGGGAVEFDENALSRLAAHAHGAPLILTGRQRHKQSSLAGGGGGGSFKQQQLHAHQHGYSPHLNQRSLAVNSFPPSANKSKYHLNAAHAVNANIAASSGQHASPNAMDYTLNGDSKDAKHISSSSIEATRYAADGLDHSAADTAVADMCLPRIIKPRKRRKKDRKPVCGGGVNGFASTTTATTAHSQCDNTVSEAAFDTVLSSLPFAFAGTAHAAGFSHHIDTHNNIVDAFEGAELPLSLRSHFSNGLKEETRPPLATAAAAAPDAAEPEASSCSCRLCDPAGRIWAFPLRRSCSDQSDATEAAAARRKNIGVIGGNRRQTVPRLEWRSSPQLLNDVAVKDALAGLDSDCGLGMSRKGSFSDSSDSGCDILSTLSFGDDPIGATSPLAESQFSGTSAATATQFVFPEVVFSESINEISRKMNRLAVQRTQFTGCRSSSMDGGGSASSVDDLLVDNSDRGANCELIFGADSCLLKVYADPGQLGVTNTNNSSDCWRNSFNLVDAPQPPQRPWASFQQPHRPNRPNRPSCIFTVMCYNVLCDKYATRQMYGYCPSWALGWDYRKKSILDEIRHYSADIICLQEIETEQFGHFFKPTLKLDGYDGIFSPKSRAKTMGENERKFVDGCAIFYRTAKFTLVKEHLVEFNQLAMANADGSDDMLNRVMPKDNIGLAALLRVNDTAWESAGGGAPISAEQLAHQQHILVCTAHIHWDPEFCDVKLIQTMMLGNELHRILEETQRALLAHQKYDPHSVQLLLCGDFNSLPDSGVIEFLSTGRVSVDHPDFKDRAGYRSCLQRLLGGTAADSGGASASSATEFTHAFKLASAYADNLMPYTNFTFDFKGVIDYIFYSKPGMVALGRLGPLSPEWLKENHVLGCPHPHIPSDHFPLLVELEMMHALSMGSGGNSSGGGPGASNGRR